MNADTQPPPAPPKPHERVLSTLEADGTRRWIDPRLSRGRFLTRRRVVAWVLIVLFTALPFLRVGGKPVLLLDVVNREFTILGTTFLPTETLLLALLLLSIFLTIFLLTALFGRVWCGWACPQTVYMEFVFRPIDRLLGWHPHRATFPRRALRLSIYLAVSFYLANTFLAYFVGTERLGEWITRSPIQHPSAFLIVAVVTLLMLVDFGFFREQMCTLACPYGRFQSVLLDRHSLIIGYDRARGEPRAKLRHDRPDDEAVGDCIDCRLCVRTCPTGIDIRDGLQLECIACAQCIDACDEVMEKIGRPKGLIRYTSQEGLEAGRWKLLRPRVVVYPLLLTLLLVTLGDRLAARHPTEVQFLRVRAAPYQVLDDGSVKNFVHLKVTNRTDGEKTYDVMLVGEGRLVCEDCPVTVAPHRARDVALEVFLPADRFERGRARILVRVIDEKGVVVESEHHVLGPLFPGGGAR